jgi:glutamyl-tRNA reductase
MNLFSIGISHHTAVVDVRERMWLSPEETREALPELRDRFFTECMLVTTCNRTEVYGISQAATVDERALVAYMLELKRTGDHVRPDHFFSHQSGGAVHHLFKVSAGIDSMVLGDIQILSQVKEAYMFARDLGTIGPVMNRLMQASLHVGKRVRTETGLCEGAVSVSYAAVELASKIFADLSKKSVLLIGAGETGELTLRHLVGKGIGQIRIANRTRAKAEALVAEFGGTVVDYEQIVDSLRAVDIVITSVNSPSYVVQPDDVQKVMRQRSHMPLFLIDIGVPRNVNPTVRRIDNVFLYDIDSLNTIVDRNLGKRKEELPRVTNIIREEMVVFFHWYKSLQVTPTIQDLRETFEVIRQQEVERNINRFKPEDRELVDLVTKRIINKLLHQPLTNLKQGAENGSRGSETMQRIKVLRDLFGIPGGGGDRGA